LNNNNLKINLNFLTNSNIELVIIIIKYTNIIYNNNNITKIQISGNFSTNISEISIQKLFLSIFTYQSQILSFSLTNCENINKNIFNFLITLINFLPSLKILNLESNRLNNEQIKFLSEKIKNNKNILALILNNNNINSDGGFHLVNLIAFNKILKQLYLSHNHLIENGLNSLFNIILNNKLTLNVLDLSYNDFESKDFESLSNFIKDDPNVNNLNLAGNLLDLNSAQILRKVLI
jgi:Ran GTPase-activating protein (RanGAP) involved in mRNA processing and transport